MIMCAPLKGPVPLLRAAWEEGGQNFSPEDQRWDKGSVVRTRQGGREQGPGFQQKLDMRSGCLRSHVCVYACLRHL